MSFLFEKVLEQIRSLPAHCSSVVSMLVTAMRTAESMDFALVTHVRVAEYVRVSAMVVLGERGSCGTVGPLSQYLERMRSTCSGSCEIVDRKGRFVRGFCICF